MSNVSMQQVKELRDRTQAGLNDCKSALVEAGGDMEKAVEVILKKGLAKSAKRAGAVASEGEVATRIAADGRSGVLVEVNIQTDFAARNDDFRKFVQAVLDAAEKAKDGADLGAEPYPGGPGTVDENRKALVGKLGENITIRRWGRLRTDGPGVVHSYVHLGGKIGVLLTVGTGSEEALKKPELVKFVDEAAMQIAAMAPLHLHGTEVSEASRAKQAEIFEAQLREAEKAPPEKQWPKIIEGKGAEVGQGGHPPRSAERHRGGQDGRRGACGGRQGDRHDRRTRPFPPLRAWRGHRSAEGPRLRRRSREDGRRLKLSRTRRGGEWEIPLAVFF
jgi:elongation factor Ts